MYTNSSIDWVENLLIKNLKMMTRHAEDTII